MINWHDVRLTSTENLEQLKGWVAEELERRQHMEEMVKQINYLLHEVVGEMTPRDALQLLDNKSLNTLIDDYTSLVEEDDDEGDWHTPQFKINYGARKEEP